MKPIIKILLMKDIVIVMRFNNDFRAILVNKGLTISGTSKDDVIVETIELSDKKFFVAVQFHPEFKSRPNKAHPLFYQLVKHAALK